MVSLDLDEQSHRSEYSINAVNFHGQITKLDEEENVEGQISGDCDGPKEMVMVPKDPAKSDHSPQNSGENDLVVISKQRDCKPKRVNKAQIKAKAKKAQKSQQLQNTLANTNQTMSDIKSSLVPQADLEQSSGENNVEQESEDTDYDEVHKIKKGLKRGRRETDFLVYKEQTLATITKLEDEIKAKQELSSCDEDEDEIKRLKNMVSAYQSRLIKRASAEENETKVQTRDQQILVIKKIIKEELTASQHTRVFRRIDVEASEEVIK